MDEHRAYNPNARQRFLSALKRGSATALSTKSKPITVDEAVVNAKSLLTKTIVSQLRAITAALEEYNKRIKELLLEFKDGNLFRSLPGVDVILAAKLLVAMGTDRERFSNVLLFRQTFRKSCRNNKKMLMSYKAFLERHRIPKDLGSIVVFISVSLATRVCELP